MRIISDVSYLAKAEGKISTDGHFYLGQHDGHTQLINGPLLCLSNIMKHVMSCHVMSCHQQQKLKLVPSSSTPRKPHPSKLWWKKWGTHGQPLYSDRQFDRIWNSEQQSQSEMFQSNGHEVLLDQIQH
jgi:hypothetical protein